MFYYFFSIFATEFKVSQKSSSRLITKNINTINGFILNFITFVCMSLQND